MNTIGVIPARGGSRGIARKNLQPICGKPLIAWTVEAALQSRGLSRVVVSTEDAEIAACAREFGAETPFVRPPELAGDDVHAVEVIIHALDELERSEAYTPLAVALLLPTSPLRTAADIDACVDILRDHPDDAVVSVAPLSRYLTQLRRIENGYARPLVSAATYNTQRQDAETLYTANGAVFLSGTAILRQHGSFHHDRTRVHVMPPERSVDIDTPFDLEIATILLSRRAGDNNGGIS